ncbi:hypothetical protein [Bdellovibrio sp. HCB274]|uniref:hypothetical protein n=1 Tax=Bdellovibrio sp. HCB274 TaxID=3394361 RepID=UPI0039B40828
MKILNTEINSSSFQKLSLINRLRDLKFEHKLLVAGFIIIGAITFLNQKPETAVAPPEEIKPESVDTFIPRGLVLIPLELANAEALSSIMGDMGGVVDLYLASDEKRSGGIIVASRVKLVRAPRNPDQFAVLVREADGRKILQKNGPFFAVVQNPDVRGANLARENQNAVRIEYSN